ncbi:hypothetical protein DERP_013644 [Dermatophagoides pteronyssinus]|uniref:Uncharacterized protein n=1 Tax=Dermatophagoides pteronyssinus TaxID=6956 RepID=A0ABQ8IPU9_DERPT|nr:hypothetical protein DERP_013644 [Dermatophagoides pteronyssinus]
MGSFVPSHRKPRKPESNPTKCGDAIVTQNNDANAASIAEPFLFINISRPASAQLGYSLSLTRTANFELKTSGKGDS